MAKSASARNQAESLERDSTFVAGDTTAFATYYLYRSGSFIGSALSCLVYDNKEYITDANVRTFEKVDVAPGEHVFTSEEDAEKTVKMEFEEGKTYLIQIMADTQINEESLLMMDRQMFDKEMSKGKFFSKTFAELGLKAEDFTFKQAVSKPN